MSFRLDQLLKASTVRVSTAGKAYEGMGFFFAPGLALTSAHVVSQAEGAMVQVFLPGEQHAVPAEVKYRFPDDVGLVILQVQTTEALPCAYLDADIKPGDQGYTFGCTGTSRKVQRVMLECEGMMGSAIGISHLAGRSKHLQLNGSPILNQRTGKVCGIVHTPNKTSGYRGEAVPMGVIFSEFPALSILQKEYHCQDNRWTTLLHPDLEALNADWSYYNRGWIRREQSIRAMLFLLRTASQWALIGARMRHVFPWRSLIALIKATFRGTLGTEIQRQYHQITRQLTSTIDPHSTSQARALHRLDAQSWVISSLMEMLITPEQDYASSSRLLWMLEILQEQRVYVQTLKRMPGNFYPQLEEFKRRWKLLEHDEKYIDTSRVLSGLINRNTDTNFSLWYTIKFFLKDFILDLAQNSKLSAHGLERLFNVLVVNLRHAVPAPTASVEDLLRDLEEEVRQNPDLKVLQKVQILMTSVSGELVQGGKFRALKGSSTYHFSPKCKLYPERAQAEEMARIICYDTEAEARQHHKACKNCLTAEKMLDRRLSDWHDSDPTAADLNAQPQPPAAVPVSNLITPDFRPNAPTLMQVPVTDRAVSVAPAADAPMPETADTSFEPFVLAPLAAVPAAPEVVAALPEVVAPVTETDPEVVVATTPEVEPQMVVATTPTPDTATPAMTIAEVAAEAEHQDDLEAVSAQIEVELAAAIAEVAQEIAAESAQAAMTDGRSQTIAPPTVKQPEAPVVSIEDLHALNTDEVSEDEDEDEVFEMAAFFVPDGDQPAIAMGETSVTATPVATTPVATTPVAETIVTPPEVVGAKPATTTKAKSNQRKSSARAPKQTKTLKDFVAAISSANKIDTKRVTAAQDDAAAPTPALKQTAKPPSQPPSQPPASPSKVAAKAAPQASKSVKVSPEPISAADSPAPIAKTPKATSTAPKSAVVPEVAAATEVAAPAPAKTPAKTQTKKAKVVASAVEAQEVTAQEVAIQEVTVQEVTIEEVTVIQSGTTAPVPPTQTKAKGGKVTRLADWAPTEATEAAPTAEAGVVSITTAKSARSKRSKAASQALSQSD